MFFAQFQDNEVMIRIFNGIRPAVVALILFPCISAVRALKLKYFQLVAPAIATVLIWQFGLSPIQFSLEEALEYIKEDEYVEVTPKAMRMRKVILDEIERKRANKN